jgi:hypothetical protein
MGRMVDSAARTLFAALAFAFLVALGVWAASAHVISKATSKQPNMTLPTYTTISTPASFYTGEPFTFGPQADVGLPVCADGTFAGPSGTCSGHGGEAN